MTKQLFQQQFGGDFKKFIESPVGQAFLVTLNAMSVPYESSEHPHLYADNRGAKRGYQICLSNILSLTLAARASQEPEANYGVSDKTN